MVWLIVVTGRPAAGKSTLAAWLGEQLGIPVISKDSIKEILFDQLGWKDRDWSRMLGRASVELMYYFAQTQLAHGNSVILDNAFHSELASPTLQAVQKQNKVNVLQIICNADSNTLFERFRQRAKSGIRHDGHVDLQSLGEFKESLKQERPLQLNIDSSIIQIDTTDFESLHYDAILQQVRSFIDAAN